MTFFCFSADALATNVPALAMGWHSMYFSPELQPSEKLKPKISTKNRYLFVCGTVVDSELQPIVILSASLLPNLLLAIRVFSFSD
ncbi:MAG: hypothetical protein WAZ36_07150 [Sediminibacterium sp.]